MSLVNVTIYVEAYSEDREGKYYHSGFEPQEVQIDIEASSDPYKNFVPLEFALCDAGL